TNQNNPYMDATYSYVNGTGKTVKESVGSIVLFKRGPKKIKGDQLASLPMGETASTYTPPVHVNGSIVETALLSYMYDVNSPTTLPSLLEYFTGSTKKNMNNPHA